MAPGRDQLGVGTEPVVPLPQVLAIAAGALLTANLVAAGPGWAASRIRSGDGAAIRVAPRPPRVSGVRWAPRLTTRTALLRPGNGPRRTPLTSHSHNHPLSTGVDRAAMLGGAPHKRRLPSGGGGGRAPGTGGGCVPGVGPGRPGLVVNADPQGALAAAQEPRDRRRPPGAPNPALTSALRAGDACPVTRR